MQTTDCVTSVRSPFSGERSRLTDYTQNTSHLTPPLQHRANLFRRRLFFNIRNRQCGVQTASLQRGWSERFATAFVRAVKFCGFRVRSAVAGHAPCTVATPRKPTMCTVRCDDSCADRRNIEGAWSAWSVRRRPITRGGQRSNRHPRCSGCRIDSSISDQ